MKSTNEKDVYLYSINKGLYVNMTNRCTCNCTFCLRKDRDGMENSGSLWLRKEPTVQEIKQAFLAWNVEKYDEVIFCGFGEPTVRLEDMLEVAQFVRDEYKKPIRLNTNGLANLAYGKDITPLFQDKIDVLSISLNAPDKERYYALTQNQFGENSFDGLLDFVRCAKQYVPKILLSTVSTTLTPQDEEACQKICDDLGVIYRIRPFESAEQKK